MPVDPSRWMRQRHSHPRIGPAYQATIPSLEGGPLPQVPLAWLGEAAVAEAENQAAAAGEASASGAASGKGAGRARGGGAATRQQGTGVQTSRPVTRKMRAIARHAEQKEELQPEEQTSVEAVPFSASLLAEAAREVKELSETIVDEKFFSEPSASTAARTDATAADRPTQDSPLASAEAEPAAETIFSRELPPATCDVAVSVLPAKQDEDTSVIASAAVPTVAILNAEIPPDFELGKGKEHESGLAKDTAPEHTTESVAALDAVQLLPTKHQLIAAEQSVQKKTKHDSSFPD